jgi:ubiquitin-protein ligase E3 B
MTGLTKIINKRWLSLFTVKELQLLLNGGEAPMDVDDWEKHTLYSGGYTARSTAVRNFWRTMRKFSPSQRRDVLKFVTSSPRPPLQGFKHLNPPFVIHKVNCAASPFAYFGAADVSRLPSASTCFNMLKLPNYRRLATLEKSVKYAVESRAGFELS